MTSPSRFRLRALAAFVLVILAVVVAAGCGGSSTGSTTPAATGTVGSTAAFSDCMKNNGLDNFDPSQIGAGGVLPAGADQAKLQKAIQACQSLAPQGAPGGTPQGGQLGAGLQKFQQCMKDNGVDNFGPGASGSQSQADQAKIQTALQACRSLAPQVGAPQGAPASGGTGNFTAFSRCMKRNGAPLPGSGSTATVDTTSPAYVKAQKKCQPLLAGGPSQ